MTAIPAIEPGISAARAGMSAVKVGVIDTVHAVEGGSASVATREARRDLVHLQRMEAHRDLIKRSSELGIGTQDLLGAQAMLGTRDLTAVSSDTVLDAAAAARSVHRNSVAIVYGNTRMAGYSPLMAELEARGARPVLLQGDRLELKGSQLLYDGRPIETPEAIIPRGSAAPVLADLERSGVHMVNDLAARRSGTSKIGMAELFKENHIDAPETIAPVTTRAGIQESSKALDLPTVFKLDRSSGGVGVFKADDAAELEVLQDQLTTPGAQPLVAQEFFYGAEGRDLRLVMVRDVHGVPQPASAYHRFAATGDFRAVGSGASVQRAPLTGDSSGFGVTPEDIETGRKVANASGLDVVGVDLMGRPAVRRVVTEFNPQPGIPEIDVPLPYDEHTLPLIADFAVWGKHGP